MGDDRIPDDVPNIVLRSRASRKHTANPLVKRPNDPLRSLAPTKRLQHASMPGGKSEVSCRRRIKLHQYFYTLPFPLQLTRYFQSNNASLAGPSEKIGSGWLHRSNFSGEMGCDILNGREQRLFRNKPFLLKREDIHLKKGLVAAKRTTEISETVVRTSGNQKGLLSAFNQRNKRRFENRLLTQSLCKLSNRGVPKHRRYWNLFAKGTIQVGGHGDRQK